MLTFRTSVFILISVVANTAQVFGGSFGPAVENKIQLSFDRIRNSVDSHEQLDQMIAIWNLKQQGCKTRIENGATWCAVRECDVSPERCRKDHTLLFRGEYKKYDSPASSELWRTLQKGSSLAQDQDIFGIVKKLDELRKLATLAIQKNNPDYKSRTNFSQYYFSAHASSQEPLDFDDPVLKKTLLIDPMISFSVNPNEAKVFAKNDEAKEKLGRLIVLSVPRKKIKSLCPASLPIPGEIIESFDCVQGLNEYDDESEVDAFLYVNPDYIWKVFNFE